VFDRKLLDAEVPNVSIQPADRLSLQLVPELCTIVLHEYSCNFHGTWFIFETIEVNYDSGDLVTLAFSLYGVKQFAQKLCIVQILVTRITDRRYYTICALKRWVFCIYVTVKWEDMLPISVATAIINTFLGVLKTQCTTGRASCDQMIVEYTHNKHWDIFLTHGTCNSRARTAA
jgi:hypothetical protein